MPKQRAISTSQLVKLLSIMDSNKDVANGRFVGGPLGHQRVTQFWENVAVTLNSLADGSSKDADHWKKYWHEVKYRAKKRATQVRQHAAGTGGGPSVKPLTEIEAKILEIMGPVAYEGNPSVQIPIDLPGPLYPAPAAVQPHDLPILVLPTSTTSREMEPVPSTSRVVEPVPSTSREIEPVPSTSREVNAVPSTSREVEPVPSTSREVEPVPSFPMEIESMPCTPVEAESVASREQEADTSQTGRARITRPRRTQSNRTRSQPRQHRIDEDVPAWARHYEERRLSLEERRLALDEQRLVLEQQNATSLAQVVSELKAIALALQRNA